VTFEFARRKRYVVYIFRYDLSVVIILIIRYVYIYTTGQCEFGEKSANRERARRDENVVVFPFEVRRKRRKLARPFQSINSKPKTDISRVICECLRPWSRPPSQVVLWFRNLYRTKAHYLRGFASRSLPIRTKKNATRTETYRLYCTACSVQFR